MCRIMTSTSCADFEEINKNPYLPDKDMEQKDGVLNGAYMPNLEKQYYSRTVQN